MTFFVGGERTTDLPGDGEQKLTVLINPVVEPLGNEMVLWLAGRGACRCRGCAGCAALYARIRYRGG